MSAPLKPQDFLLSARDFFAVIVPGAIFLLLLPDRTLAEIGLGTTGPRLLGFAIAAYLAGSVFSALGSVLDLLVDPVLEGEGFRAIRFRKLRLREKLADKLRKQLIAECPCPIMLEEHPERVKNFWWTHLRLNCPAAMIELDRIEATQKLFRSLAPVFVILAILSVPGLGAWLDPHWLRARSWSRRFHLVCLHRRGLLRRGRIFFLSSVYRLGAAFCLRECLQDSPSGPPPNSPRRPSRRDCA